MTREDILHLGTLARIKLTDAEVATLTSEIESILGYVSEVNKIVADSGVTKQVGARYNVFRDDVVTNKPNEYTNTLIAEMPVRDGRYLAVKKILNQE